jgi:F0F1-type ATP synthase membrane subunit c/vacuolar-type H+-ATPase subunit K
MSHKLPELTQRQIQKVWKTTDQSRREIALQFGVSESTVKRLTNGLTREAPAAGAAVVGAALANGAAVLIDGVPIGRYVADTIVALAAELSNAPAKSKEGVAGALLKYLEFHERLHPQRLEVLVDQLLAHPDFSIERVGELLRRRAAG